jgi:hypothetical protein
MDEQVILPINYNNKNNNNTGPAQFLIIIVSLAEGNSMQLLSSLVYVSYRTYLGAGVAQSVSV